MKPEETLIVLMRHGAHKNGFLTEEALEEAQHAGWELAKKGINIASYVSSPEPRAIQTAIAVMKGQAIEGHADGRNQPMPITDTDLNYCFGSVRCGIAYTDAELAALKNEAAQRELSVEACLLVTDQAELAKKRHHRAIVASHELSKLVGSYNGQTILVTSHSGSCIEPLVAEVSGLDLSQIKVTKPGGMVGLRFYNGRFHSVVWDIL